MHEMNTTTNIEPHAPPPSSIFSSYALRGDSDEVEVETELDFEKSSTDIADWMHSSFSWQRVKIDVVR